MLSLSVSLHSPWRQTSICVPPSIHVFGCFQTHCIPHSCGISFESVAYLALSVWRSGSLASVPLKRDFSRDFTCARILWYVCCTAPPTTTHVVGVDFQEANYESRQEEAHFVAYANGLTASERGYIPFPRTRKKEFSRDWGGLTFLPRH